MIKYYIFQILERISLIINKNPSEISINGPLTTHCMDEESIVIWLYCSTIGELNAIEPFLRKLLSIYNAKLVLITEKNMYKDAFQNKFPAAHVVETQGGINEIRQIYIRLSAPGLFILSEIPCLLHDAPCRFPMLFCII